MPPLQPGRNVIVDAVDRVGPAVVRIDTVRRAVNPLGSLFGGGPAIQQQQGQGSGFITRSDGVVLTNAHVVEGANEVHVTLPDGRSFSGKVLGAEYCLPGFNEALPQGDVDDGIPGLVAAEVGQRLYLGDLVFYNGFKTVDRGRLRHYLMNCVAVAIVSRYVRDIVRKNLEDAR